MQASRLLFLVLCFAFAFPQPVFAGANDPDDGCLRDTECRGHYEKAMKSYSAGRYEAALPEFQAAYGLRQMPWLLVNIGRTLHRLGRLEEAVQYYNNYEKASLGADPDTLKKVREYRTQAQAALEAMKAGGSNFTPPSATTTPPVTQTPPPQSRPADEASKPFYKKWWFWTIVGGAAAVTIIGVGVGVGVSNSNKDPIPPNAPIYTPTF